MRRRRLRSKAESQGLLTGGNMKKGFKNTALLALFVLVGSVSAIMAQAPSWAVGTFSARNPQDGGTIYMTVDRNGSVTVHMGDTVTYGRMNSSTLTINGESARVSRRGSGFRTTRFDNRERIDYSRYNGQIPTPGPGWGSGGGVPSWAVGTFNGRNPQTGGNIQLTINQNGQVTANMNGTVTYGNLSGDHLNMSGARARVSRLNNGIVTTRTDNGERIEYYRYGSGPGWGGNNPNPGMGGNVVSWAVGTFRGRNPNNGGQIIMTISKDGSAVVNMDGNTEYGYVNRDRLTINGVTSRLERTRNGIRTVRQDNRERIEYSRN